MLSVLRRHRRGDVVMSREERKDVLRRALDLDVDGRRPAGRLKKTWRLCAEEDMSGLNTRKESVYSRQEWEGVVAHPNPA